MYFWEKFFQEKIIKIFNEKQDIMDIGGGLRALPGIGNRYDAKRAWITPLIQKVNYKILDLVPDYKPDIIGDIHRLPFKEKELDAVICIAVMEHVENPFQAVHEMHRVLKEGGYCFVYVPFLYYYHAHEGYYKDYWRYTNDAIDLLFKNFSSKEVCNVRGALSTWLRISPLGKYKLLESLFILFDKIFGKTRSKQTSGYYIFLIK